MNRRTVQRIRHALFLCLTVLLLATAARADTLTGFSIEQVYLNVPEMDIFLQVQTAQGSTIDPTLVRAAGVEVRVGDTQVPTGNIALANEPICYLLVLDNAADEETLQAYRSAVSDLIRAKQDRDQILLYTTGTEAACVLPATADAGAALAALRAIGPDEGSSDLLGAAALVAQDVNDGFQSLAPRKVLLVCTPAYRTLASLAVLGGMADNSLDRLNLPLTVYATRTDTDPLSLLPSDLSAGKIRFLTESELAEAMLEDQRQLASALEIKTAVDPALYGEKLDVVTVSVPSLGSAVRATAAVYMGHRLTPPAVERVEITGRNRLTVTFNQAVGQGGTRCYEIRSEDIWNWNVGVAQAELSADGRTAVLTTDPLYDGRYTLRLDELPSAITPANLSDDEVVFRFEVDGWPRDRAFYLARFRLPVTVMLLAVAVLAAANAVQRRRDRAAEKQAEAEHLLSDASRSARDYLPVRRITFYCRPRRSIAEVRTTVEVRGSLLLGSDPDQCDYCLADPRVRAQHAVLAVEEDQVTIRALGDAVVRVNGERIGDPHRLHNDDEIRLGRTTLRLVL